MYSWCIDDVIWLSEINITVNSLYDISREASSRDWFWSAIAREDYKDHIQDLCGGGKVHSDTPTQFTEIKHLPRPVGLSFLVARYLGKRLEKDEKVQMQDWSTASDNSSSRCESHNSLFLKRKKGRDTKLDVIEDVCAIFDVYSTLKREWMREEGWSTSAYSGNGTRSGRINSEERKESTVGPILAEFRCTQSHLSIAQKLMCG